MKTCVKPEEEAASTNHDGDVHCDIFMFLIHFQDKMLLGNKQPNLKHFFVSNEFGQILFVQT